MEPKPPTKPTYPRLLEAIFGPLLGLHPLEWAFIITSIVIGTFAGANVIVCLAG